MNTGKIVVEIAENHQIRDAWIKAYLAFIHMEASHNRFVSSAAELVAFIKAVNNFQISVSQQISRRVKSGEPIGDIIIEAIQRITVEIIGSNNKPTNVTKNGLSDIARTIIALQDSSNNKLSDQNRNLFTNWYKKLSDQQEVTDERVEEKLRQHCTSSALCVTNFMSVIFPDQWQEAQSSVMQSMRGGVPLDSSFVQHFLTTETKETFSSSVTTFFYKSSLDTVSAEFDELNRRFDSLMDDDQGNPAALSSLLVKYNDLIEKSLQKNLSLPEDRKKLANIMSHATIMRSKIRQQLNTLDIEKTFKSECHKKFTLLRGTLINYVVNHPDIVEFLNDESVGENKTQYITNLVMLLKYDRANQADNLDENQKQVLRHPKIYRAFIALAILSEFHELISGVAKNNSEFSYREYNSAIEFLFMLLEENNRLSYAWHSNNFAECLESITTEKNIDVEKSVRELCYLPDSEGHNMSWRIRHVMGLFDAHYDGVKPGSGYWWLASSGKLLPDEKAIKAHKREQIHLFLRDACQRIRTGSASIEAILKDAKDKNIADLYVDDPLSEDEAQEIDSGQQAYTTVGELLREFLGNSDVIAGQVSRFTPASKRIGKEFEILLASECKKFAIHSACRELFATNDMQKLKSDFISDDTLSAKKPLSNNCKFSIKQFLTRLSHALTVINGGDATCSPERVFCDFFAEYPIKYQQELMKHYIQFIINNSCEKLIHGEGLQEIIASVPESLRTRLLIADSEYTIENYLTKVYEVLKEIVNQPKRLPSHAINRTLRGCPDKFVSSMLAQYIQHHITEASDNLVNGMDLEQVLGRIPTGLHEELITPDTSYGVRQYLQKFSQAIHGAQDSQEQRPPQTVFGRVLIGCPIKYQQEAVQKYIRHTIVNGCRQLMSGEEIQKVKAAVPVGLLREKVSVSSPTYGELLQSVSAVYQDIQAEKQRSQATPKYGNIICEHLENKALPREYVGLVRELSAGLAAINPNKKPVPVAAMRTGMEVVGAGVGDLTVHERPSMVMGNG